MSILSVTLTLSALMLMSCSSGSSKRDNPFEPEGDAHIKVEYESNADSVSLKWTLTGDLDFDSFKVETAGGDRKTLGKDARTCTLTHFPYNTPTKVVISMLDGNSTVEESTLYVVTDGIDSVIQSLIIPDRGSVTAGDGMYSIALPDDRSIFLMGDSYIGPVNNGHRSTSDHMYRNSYSVFNHKTLTSYAIVGANNHSAAVPENQPNEAEWYWPGHGFVCGDRLYIFQELMYQGEEGAWGFRYRNTHLLQYSLPDITLVKDARVPYYGADNIHFGAAALADGDYNYIYAQVDIRNDLNPVTEVYVARATEQNLWGPWEYWDGNTWTDVSERAAALQGLASVPVSSQFNVFKLRGKYVLLTQNKALGNGEIYTFTSDTPQGPWTNRKVIYKVQNENSSWYTYNAMAHPQFERDNLILVSYNVNTSNFSEQFSNVYSYRPRFFWVPIDDILN